MSYEYGKEDELAAGRRAIWEVQVLKDRVTALEAEVEGLRASDEIKRLIELVIEYRSNYTWHSHTIPSIKTGSKDERSAHTERARAWFEVEMDRWKKAALARRELGSEGSK